MEFDKEESKIQNVNEEDSPLEMNEINLDLRNLNED